MQLDTSSRSGGRPIDFVTSSATEAQLRKDVLETPCPINEPSVSNEPARPAPGPEPPPRPQALRRRPPSPARPRSGPVEPQDPNGTLAIALMGVVVVLLVLLVIAIAMSL